MKMETMSAKKRFFAVGGAWLVAPILVAGTLVFAWLISPGLRHDVGGIFAFLGSLDAGAIRDWTLSFGAFSPFVYFLIMVGQVIANPIPSAPVTLAGAMLFGVREGLALSMAGAVVGSSVVFLAVRKWGAPLVVRLVGEETFHKYAGRLDANGVWIFTIFLVPFMPDDAICALAGLSAVSFRRFLVVMSVGRLPGAAITALLASDGITNSTATFVTAGLVVAVLFALGVAYRKKIEAWISQRAKDETISRTDFTDCEKKGNVMNDGRDDVRATPSNSKPGRLRRWTIRATAALCVAALGAGAWWTLGTPGILWGASLFADDEKPPVRFALPETTGEHPVGVAEMRLVDLDRFDPWVRGEPRELMVSVWYPAAETGGRPLAPYMKPKAAAHFENNGLQSIGLEPDDVDLERVRTHAFSDAPVDASRRRPVVLYSPGGGLPRTVGTALVEDLASRGYVVVAVDHTYEASEVEFPNGRLKTAKLPEDAGIKKMVSVRVSDVRFVLDRLETIRDGEELAAEESAPPDGLADALDLSEIGVFGHSAGGFTSAEAMLEDRRIDAGVNLDGSMMYSAERGEFGEVAKRGLDRPFMLMGAGKSGEDELPHTHRDSPDWKAFWDSSSGPKLDLHIPEGEHFTFTDYQTIIPQLDDKLGLPEPLFTGTIGTVDPERAVASERAYVGAFFDRHLEGEREELLEGPSPRHPDVDFIGRMTVEGDGRTSNRGTPSP